MARLTAQPDTEVNGKRRRLGHRNKPCVADQCGVCISSKRPVHIRTFANLVDLHIADMHQVKRPLRRSKAHSLRMLKTHLGPLAHCKLDHERLVDYGRFRAKADAGPETAGTEPSHINTVISHAAFRRTVPVSGLC